MNAILRRRRQSGNILSQYLSNGIRPVGVLDFARGVYVGAGGRVSDAEDVFTYGDGSSKTMFDATGTLVTVAQGTPRYNSHVYENGAWVNKGLLIESEARTNLETQSVSLSNYVSQKVQCGITQGQADPFGGTSASLFTYTGTSKAYSFGSVLSTAVVKTGSMWVKAGTRSKGSIQIGAGSAAGGVRADFDLVANTISFTLVTTGYSQIGTPSIVSFGGGWFRVSVSAECPGTDHTLYISDSNSAEASVLGSTFYFCGAQLEAGSTPSSYIPTNGSTVTRAAETAVIEPENNPLLVRGPELVTNGGFDADTAGWTPNGTASLSVVSGAMRITHSSNEYASTPITTVIGQTYLLTFDEVGGDTGSYRLLIGNSAGSGSILVGSTTQLANFGSVSLLFTATATTTYVSLQCFGTGYKDFDNVSVIPLTMPTALSIGMMGTMTYADTSVDTQVLLLDWDLDISNRIYTRIYTVGADTGGLAYRQVEGGVGSQVYDPSTYSPGINVPFNIASRHGATFINGAVDGTALTANTTPTALADLTTADFQIAPTFMGHIQELPLYADNVADTGLEEITG